MTEEKIYEILLKNPHDDPKLHPETANSIAQSLTDVIYDSLRLKSTSERLNVLKFINTLGSYQEGHVSVNETNFGVFVDSIEAQFDGNDDESVGALEPKSLCQEVLEFYARRNNKRVLRTKRLEFIKKWDLGASDGHGFLHRPSYYETNENIIRALLGDEEKQKNCHTLLDIKSPNYREKQVKFGYALVHLKQWKTLKKLLERRLQKYPSLLLFEKKFLFHLNESLGGEGEALLRQILVENFAFIYETLILDFCTQLIQSEDFFETLLCDKNFLIIKKLCVDDAFRLKLKNMLFELYSYSYCNTNLLKFINLFQ